MPARLTTLAALLLTSLALASPALSTPGATRPDDRGGVRGATVRHASVASPVVAGEPKNMTPFTRRAQR